MNELKTLKVWQFILMNAELPPLFQMGRRSGALLQSLSVQIIDIYVNKEFISTNVGEFLGSFPLTVGILR